MEKTEAMALLPIFLKLYGRPCVVVGGGRIAESRIIGLEEAGAAVIVIAPKATRRVEEWARAGRVQWLRRRFRPRDLDGAALVISATNSQQVNKSVFEEARQRRIFCNAVDDPKRCDFYYGAVVRRGDLQIAISTSGACPSLAQRLRRDLERQLTQKYAAWVEQLRRSRSELRTQPMSKARRLRALQRLASHRGFLKFSAAGNNARSNDGSR